MKTISGDMSEAIKYNTKKWIIELSNLDEGKVFMGNALSCSYLMIGITAPSLESQISINSIPDDGAKEIRVPICLEKCSPILIGELTFKGIEKMLSKWDCYFIDNRFDLITKLVEGGSVQIKVPSKNRKSEYLKLIRYDNLRTKYSHFFELILKPI